MSEARYKLLDRFHKRLQFVILLVLFFPTLLNALYGIGGEDLSVNNTILSWSMILVMLVIVFVVAEVMERKMSMKLIQYSNNLLLLETIALILLMSIFIIYENGPLTTLANSILKCSLIASFMIPSVLMLFVLLGTFCREEAAYIDRFFKKFLRTKV
jgi:membrane-associated HD superfamily phosphohydrolase